MDIENVIEMNIRDKLASSNTLNNVGVLLGLFIPLIGFAICCVAASKASSATSDLKMYPTLHEKYRTQEKKANSNAAVGIVLCIIFGVVWVSILSHLG